MPVTVMPAREVIASYHWPRQVEASFRVSKTGLRARPMFHHALETIEAHLCVVITALTSSRHLQNVTGRSIRKIVQTLRPLQQIL
ncbi:hypothetical protein [Arthrobacter echini]|uniref:hypothetical protein n=1 Tax=Arthrobacter echini TaxID=1529066 RepID=UPI001652683F|nr:hypothetical protein [Arthrobacter echini]